MLKYEELRAEDEGANQPARRLVLAKRAITAVTRAMCRDKKRAETITSEDKLGWTMRFLRAAEGLHVRSMEKCVEAYPHLCKLADCHSPNVRIRLGLTKVREHAIELARNSVRDDLNVLGS